MEKTSEPPIRPLAGFRKREPRSRTDFPVLVLLVGGTAIIAGAVTAIRGSDLNQARGQLYNLIVFDHLFARYDFPSAWVVLGAMVLAVATGRYLSASMIDAALRWISTHRLTFALIATAVLAVIAPWVSQGYPLAMDEFAPLFQSKVFAAGHLAAIYPHELVQRMVPMPGEFLKISRMTGEVMIGQWPVFSALLTPFSLMGVPWLLNPLVAGATLLLIAYLASRLLPEQPLAPGWAMLLTLASPQFVAYGISGYSMALHLLLALAYAALFLAPTSKRLLAAGVVGSVALCLNNPFPHAVFAVPWIVWLAGRPGRVRNLFALGLGYLPIAAIGFVWIWLVGRVERGEMFAVHGKAVPAAYAIKTELENQAFHIPGSVDFSHFFQVRAMWLCKLALWAVPGIVLVAALGYRHVRQQPVARLLMWSFVAMWTAYLFVAFDQGHGWGARYFHIVWGVIPLLGAAWLTSDPAGQRWTRCFALLSVMSLFVLVPQRLMQMRQFTAEAQTQQPEHDANAREAVFVNMNPGGGRYWAQDAVRNDPFLRNPAIMFSSKTPENDEALMEHFYPGSKRLSLGAHGSVWSLPPENAPRQ